MGGSVTLPVGQGEAIRKGRFPVGRSKQLENRSKSGRGNGVASVDAAPFLRAAAEWKGYVNVEQTDSTKEHFRAFSDDLELVSETIGQALLSGYKLSVVQNDDEETCKATAYAAFKGMPDSGLSVSAWASNALQALAAVAYIVVIQAQLDLSRYDDPSTRVRRRTF